MKRICLAGLLIATILCSTAGVAGASTITPDQIQSGTLSFIPELNLSILTDTDLLKGVAGLDKTLSQTEGSLIIDDIQYGESDQWRLLSINELSSCYELGLFEEMVFDSNFESYFWSSEIHSQPSGQYPATIKVLSATTGTVTNAWNDGGLSFVIGMDGYAQGAQTVSSNPVPEPTSMLLLGGGLLGFAGVLRKKSGT